VEKPLSPQLRRPTTSGFGTPRVIELRSAQPLPHSSRHHAMTGGAGITATDIAWCADIDRARRERWASAGRLKRDPPFTEHDAMETAIAFSLACNRVSQKAAAAAWTAIQQEVQRLLIAGERRIWVVISAEGPWASAVADAGSAARAADGKGRCWIVDTTAMVAEARSRYVEVAARAAPADGHVTPIRRPSHDVRRIQ
jgi:hypothetical protein